MIVRFPRLTYEKKMKRRLSLIFIWLLSLIQSTTIDALHQNYDASPDVDEDTIRSYLQQGRGIPRRESYQNTGYGKLNKNPLIQERDAQLQPSLGLYGHQENNIFRRVEPEDREIDSISRFSSSFLGGSDDDETIPPVSESGPRSASQPETVPMVAQKMSGDGQKELRAPQKPPPNSMAQVSGTDGRQIEKPNDVYFIGLVAGCSGAALFGVMAAGFCWYKLQKNAKAAAAADYPAYGMTGPGKEAEVTSPPNGDRKLAQNAQMFHYQHQKQQMIAIEKAASDRRASTSDLDSEEENEEGDYTVYECPGLAPTGEMEVKNPLFRDDPTPVSPPAMSKDSEKQLQQQ